MSSSSNLRYTHLTLVPIVLKILIGEQGYTHPNWDIVMEVKNIKLLNYLYEIWTWSRTTCVPFPFSETMTMLCTVKYMAQLHYQYSTWELMLTFIQKLYLPFVDVPLWIVSLSFMMFMMFAMFYESVISWSWISCDSQFSINLKCDVLSFNAHWSWKYSFFWIILFCQGNKYSTQASMFKFIDQRMAGIAFQPIENSAFMKAYHI